MADEGYGKILILSTLLLVLRGAGQQSVVNLLDMVNIP